MPKRKQTSKKKLVSPSSSKETGDALNGTETDPLADTSSTKEKDQPIISYWWPNVTIHATSSDDPLPVQSPPLVLQQLRLTPDGKSFYPFFFVNDFWMLQENLNPINETVQSLNVSLSFSPLAMWKFQLYTQFQESFRIQQDVMGVAQSETDQMKVCILLFYFVFSHNPYEAIKKENVFGNESDLACHYIRRLVAPLGLWLFGFQEWFVFLCIFYTFMNSYETAKDIDFWKNRKDMEGLSFRTILLNVIFQSIIFLYLLDNDTSWMILISSGIGLLIEIWKINKSVKTVRKPTFPYVEFKDRVKPSKLTSKTRAYDELAFTYLSWAFFPLLVGYTVYSLLYEEHKSWYSFTVGTLVGFVYTFGFISMTPQLFINYKLKSVAHMPWKTFMYKGVCLSLLFYMWHIYERNTQSTQHIHRRPLCIRY